MIRRVLNYREKKAKIREEAIQYQIDFASNNWSMQEIMERQAYFETMGKRYGLTREFKENGII